jgi:AcrR family transcriptional regulator
MVKNSKLLPRKNPSQNRSQETVENIYQATTHILEDVGLEKLSTNKIAEKAGISIGSLYQYFPTKEAIISAMMERYLHKQVSIIELKLQSLDHKKTLEETVEVLVEATIEGKRKASHLTKLLAQKIFGFGKLSLLQKQDDYLLSLFKIHLERFKHEIREENLDFALFLIIQVVKIIPISILFQSHFKLSDPMVKFELVRLVVGYLKK